MAKAMQEVERLRLEMQRANERIQAAQGVENVVVKKKKKKAKPAEGDETVVKKKKAKNPVVYDGADGAGPLTMPEEAVKPKKKKKKKPKIEDESVGMEL